MSIKKSSTKQNSGIGRQSSRPAFAKRTKIKPRSAAKSKSVGIFRPDILDYSPIEKSGYSSLKIYLPEEEQFDGKVLLATEWLECLKQHESYKPILIDAESTIDVVFQLLHNETNRLLDGYSWMFIFSDETEPRLLYYESLGDVNCYQLPLDWLSESTNLPFKNAGLWLLKSLSEHFGIRMIFNDLIEMAIDNYAHYEDEYELISNIKSNLGVSSPEEMGQVYEAAADLCQYQYGKPKELKKRLSELGYSKELFNELVGKIMIQNHELADWLLSGYRLLNMESTAIENFNLVPEDLNLDNGDPVCIHHSIFFPYSFTGFVFDEYESWLNDIAQGIGTNDIYNWGFLNSKIHFEPCNKEPLLALIEFLEKGRELYFKKHEN